MEKNKGDVILMYSGRVEACSERLKKALSIREMKQAELCNRTNTPKSSLSLYLSGAYEPKQDRLYEIAKVLDVDPVWLMGYDVPMEKKTPPTVKVNLTEAERLMLDLFNQVPEESQEMVLDMIRIALKKKK